MLFPISQLFVNRLFWLAFGRSLPAVGMTKAGDIKAFSALAVRKSNKQLLLFLSSRRRPESATSLLNTNFFKTLYCIPHPLSSNKMREKALELFCRSNKGN
jgi:hypothetical protein